MVHSYSRVVYIRLVIFVRKTYSLNNINDFYESLDPIFYVHYIYYFAQRPSENMVVQTQRAIQKST